MGHYSISITLDLYGHLMPGSEDEAAALLDAYLVTARQLARQGDTVRADEGEEGEMRSVRDQAPRRPTRDRGGKVARSRA